MSVEICHTSLSLQGDTERAWGRGVTLRCDVYHVAGASTGRPLPALGFAYGTDYASASCCSGTRQLWCGEDDHSVAGRYRAMGGFPPLEHCGSNDDSPTKALGLIREG